jgi:uncharacterized HAD superfamily protein
MRAKEIDRLVSRIMKINIDRIRAKGGKGSNRKESEARFIAMYLRNKYLKQSLNSLAKEWGYANHTVTLIGINNLKNHLETEKELAYKVTLLGKMVEQRLQEIKRNKKRYNDHLMLKNHSIEVKNEIVSIDENKYNSLSNSCMRKLKSMVEMKRGVQFALGF